MVGADNAGPRDPSVVRSAPSVVPVEAAVCCLVRRKKFRFGDAVAAVQGDLLDVEVLAEGNVVCRLILGAMSHRPPTHPCPPRPRAEARGCFHSQPDSPRFCPSQTAPASAKT